MTRVKEFKGTARFSLQRRLGEGGFGVVFQAYDRDRNAMVALKALHQTDSEALYHFKREFRALANVTHTNLVGLYELLNDGDQWFFTMELIEGVNFLEYVGSFNKDDVIGNLITLRTDRETVVDWESARTVKVGEMLDSAYVADTPLPAHFQLDIDRLRTALRQLCEGVQALHEAGKLHRDIKPSNVLVTKDHRVVLLDFGLATELGARMEVDIVGTPAYMSPEQGAGNTVDEATDWYSIGVMLYQGLTGRLPFTGEALDIIDNKQRYEPPAPSELVNDLPEDLNQLCQLLLHRDPQARPKGREILARLNQSSSLADALGLNTRSTTFVGRANQLALLYEAFETTRKGQPVIAYVHGSSGLGKSSLVRRFIDEMIELEPHAVLFSGRCYEWESVPYKAMDSVIDELSQYLRQLTPPELEKMMPEDSLALARLFPVLRQVAEVAGARRDILDIPDSQELRRRAFAALKELLLRLSRVKPILIFIDDLQWGDSDSAILVAEILRHPDPPPILLVGTYRSEDAHISSFLRTFAKSNIHVATRELVIKELDFNEAKHLALSRIGPNQPGANDLAEAIARESGGNPFFIDELVRYIRTDTGSPLGKSGSSARATTLEEVILARVERLSDDARKLLQVLAVVGQPIERNVAKAATQIDRDDQAALSLLRARHLIKVNSINDQEMLEPYHDRIRETIVAWLSNDELRLLHRNIAQSLEATGKADPELLLIHYHGAGDPERAVEFAVKAAEKATEALAFEQSARFYRYALEAYNIKTSSVNTEKLRMNPQRAHALRVKFADAMANSGRAAEAGKLYLEAAESASPVESLILRRRGAEQYLISGNIDEGLKVLNTVLGMVGLKLSKTSQQALFSLLFKRLQIWLRGLKYRVRQESELPVKDLIRVDTCASVIIGLGMVDTVRAAEFQARHLLLALKAGEPFRIAQALSFEAGYCAAAGGVSQRHTTQLLQSAHELAEQVKHLDALTMSSFKAGITIMSGITAYNEGRWKDSVELCDRAESIVRESCTKAYHELHVCQLFNLRSRYYLGQWANMVQNLKQYFQEARERGDLLAEINLSTRISYLAKLAADQADEAQWELDQAMNRWTYPGFNNQNYFNLVAQVDVALYRGDIKAAWQQITDQWPAFNNSLFLRVQFARIEALHTRARGALASALAAPNRREMLAIAEKDAKKIEKDKMVWGNALAWLIYAGIETVRANSDSALKQLKRAEEGFNNVDMALFAQVARRRRGQLLGSDTGRQLVIEVDNWMRSEKIVAPAKLADMLAPGKWQ